MLRGFCYYIKFAFSSRPSVCLVGFANLTPSLPPPHLHAAMPHICVFIPFTTLLFRFLLGDLTLFYLFHFWLLFVDGFSWSVNLKSCCFGLRCFCGFLLWHLRFVQFVWLLTLGIFGSLTALSAPCDDVLLLLLPDFFCDIKSITYLPYSDLFIHLYCTDQLMILTMPVIIM